MQCLAEMFWWCLCSLELSASYSLVYPIIQLLQGALGVAAAGMLL